MKQWGLKMDNEMDGCKIILKEDGTWVKCEDASFKMGIGGIFEIIVAFAFVFFLGMYVATKLLGY